MHKYAHFIGDFKLVLVCAIAGFITTVLISSPFVLNSMILLSIGGTVAILSVAISAGVSIAKRSDYAKSASILFATIINFFGQANFYGFLGDSIYNHRHYGSVSQMYFPTPKVDILVFFSYSIQIALIVTLPLCVIFVRRLTSTE